MKKIIILLASLIPLSAMAESISMNFVNNKGIGNLAGTIKLSESKYGVVFSPQLKGLTPGFHGFHIHQHASCMPKTKAGKSVPALAAGGHYDPGLSKKHGTPWGDGHLGDLPPLFVDANGNADQAVLAPRLKMAQLQGKAFMIHGGGDNHSDQPKALGGGGARVACGIAK
ncbi:MAG: superoxide dismutase [Cu-Zn] SodC [Methylococcales bacterium]|jgi:Cu-Zn family superoxide dismutase